MTYPGEFGRIVASGTLYGAETFSIGLSSVPNFVTTYPIDPATLVDDIADVFATWWATQQIASAAALTTVKFNKIGPDGRYVSQDETVLADITPPVTGGGTSGQAPQVALAVTLNTNRLRGLAARGRFYLPVPSPDVQADGAITQATAQLFADGATELINDLNAILGEQRPIGVASDVRGGSFQVVRSVRVGRVYDTIRSRRRALPEDYVEGAPIEV